MSRDYRLEYWSEAFAMACEEAGIWDDYNALSDDQKKAAAECIRDDW